MENNETIAQAKKVAIYCRVSSNKQTNENQLTKLLQYATDKLYKFDLFEEIESTRKTRPIKQDLLNRVRKGEYSAIVVFKLDRFARSMSELINDVEELVKRKVGFISISENLDFSTAAGELQFHILSAFSQFERSIIRDRTIEGIARAKAKGKLLGRPKGRKDSNPRPTSGYVIREANKRKKLAEGNGVFQSVESYIKNTPPNK
ncbi:MAG: recombinase family protein [Sphingobacteriaceae bacterium]|jgi:putative DNA-invertase from lambdoid prophage Rac